MQPEQTRKATGVRDTQDSKSVLAQSSLDEFIGMAELAKSTFDGTRGLVHIIDDSPQLVCGKTKNTGPTSVCVPIPWRPHWHEGMSAEDFATSESDAFLEWRRGIARIEEKEGMVMTPYERNLTFWRQLWQCVDKSDLLVQVLDSRDPMFYRSQDLERYVEHFGSKRHLLLLNKSDLLSPELRQRWANHFRECGIDVIFFSALNELQRMQELPITEDLETATMSRQGPFLSDNADVMNSIQLIEELRTRLLVGSGLDHGRRGVIGFVGYPNVGKSSVINALYGAKKVSVCRRPGKTKHLQTLEIKDTAFTLCDCPGLVFPSIVATKAHLAINGTMPIDELQDHIAPVRLIIEKIGINRMLDKYSLDVGALHEGAGHCGTTKDNARAFLAGFSSARQHFLRLGVPDETWAARKVLRDFCSGELLHCEHPFGSLPANVEETPQAPESSKEFRETAKEHEGNATAPTASLAAPANCDEEFDGDFNDIDALLLGDATSCPHEQHMTKRQQRQFNKRLQKGGETCIGTLHTKA